MDFVSGKANFLKKIEKTKMLFLVFSSVDLRLCQLFYYVILLYYV